MPGKRRNRKDRDNRLSMRMKITLGLGSIAVMLLVSSVITVLEYRRMNNYVSDLLGMNIKCINLRQTLSRMCEEYNLQILATIGEDGRLLDQPRFDEDSLLVAIPETDGYGMQYGIPEVIEEDEQYETPEFSRADMRDRIPEIDEKSFLSLCDSIRLNLGTRDSSGLIECDLADSLECAFAEYISESHNVEDYILSDFTESRRWFFLTLQPLYNKVQTNLYEVSNEAYSRLQINSMTFKESFYRSITPGMVAVGAGLVLILLLLVFLITYYVNPVYKMLNNIQNSLLMRTKYKCTFEGNDQMAELNERITDIMDENIELHRRVKSLREDKERLIEQMESSEE